MDAASGVAIRIVAECAKEARRIEETADFSAQVQFEAAKAWASLSTILSLSAAIAAFASGATILQAPEWRALAGIFAFAAGALGAANTVLRGQDRAAESVRAGKAWRRCRDMARVHANIDLLMDESGVAARQGLAQVIEAFNAADEGAPVVGWAFWATWRARRNLRRGLTTTRVDAAK